MPQKTRKSRKNKTSKKCNSKYNKYHMRTCRANKYKSVYGGNADSIRSNRPLFY